MKTESRSMVARQWKERRWGDFLRGRFPLDQRKYSETDIVVRVTQPCDHTKTTERHILHGWIVWHVSYISIKLLKFTRTPKGLSPFKFKASYIGKRRICFFSELERFEVPKINISDKYEKIPRTLQTVPEKELIHLLPIKDKSGIIPQTREKPGESDQPVY